MQPLAAPSSVGGGVGTKQQQQPAANLLDLDDLFGGGGGDVGGESAGVSSSGPASVGGAGTGASTVDLMADIFSSPSVPAAPSAATMALVPASGGVRFVCVYLYLFGRKIAIYYSLFIYIYYFFVPLVLKFSFFCPRLLIHFAIAV